MDCNKDLVKSIDDVSSLKNKLILDKTKLNNLESIIIKTSSTIKNTFKKVTSVVERAFDINKSRIVSENDVLLDSYVIEMEEKFNIIFKTTSHQIENWIETFSKKTGINNIEIKVGVSPIGYLLIACGMTEEEACNLSKDLMELAYDLAISNNIYYSESIEIMTNCILGDYYDINALGVYINEEIIKDKISEMELSGNLDELNEATKVELRYQTVREQTNDTQEDITIFNDSGNSSRSASSTQIEDVKGFIKDLEDIIRTSYEFSTAFSSAKEEIDSFAGALASAFESIGLTSISELILFVDDLREKLGIVPEKLKEWEQPLTVIAILLGALATAFTVYAISQDLALIATTIGVGALNALSIMQSIAAVTTNVLTVAVGFFTATTTLVILAIGAVIAIGYLLIKNWDEVKLFLAETWDAIKQVALDVWEGIKAKISEVMEVVGEIISTVWEGIKTTISTVMNFISEIISNIWNSILSVISTILSVITEIISTVWEGIKTIISTVMNFISEIISNIWNGISSFISGVVNTISEIISSGFKAISNTVSGIFNGLKSTVMGIWNGIGKGIQGVVNGIIKVINSMVRAMNKISFDIPDWVPVMGGKTFGFNIPTISEVSWFASGGIVKGSENGTVIGVGEDGDEAIVPLSNKSRMKPFAEAVGGMIIPDINNTNKYNSGEVTIQVSQLIVREEADVNRIAQELYRLQERNRRRSGVIQW